MRGQFVLSPFEELIALRLLFFGHLAYLVEGLLLGPVLGVESEQSLRLGLLGKVLELHHGQDLGLGRDARRAPHLAKRVLGLDQELGPL